MRGFYEKLTTIQRVAVVVFIPAMVLAILLYFILRPSLADQVSKTWCVDQIYYKNKLIGPKTLLAVYIVYSNGKIPCYENMDIRANGDIMLPGINTRGIDGGWQFGKNDSLQMRVDTLKNVFEGVYSIEVSLNKLVLRSKQTVIYAHIDRTRVPDLF